MAKPTVSYRRIDQLKAIAFDRGFTNEDARQFGKLSKTATWGFLNISIALDVAWVKNWCDQKSGAKKQVK
ncbi:hypothetical protein QUA70_20020 [Microcoleus sp. LAD1_D5]|uniref:hypothetical protein n=1 Tax=unclassified Microcoleus TaxID=2642155 RepID=UPI002FD22028